MELFEALLLFLLSMFVITGLVVWAIVTRIMRREEQNKDLGIDTIDLRPAPTITPTPTTNKTEVKQNKLYSANSSWWNQTG